MRKLISTVSLCCISFLPKAQVLLTLQLPPAGLQLKSQLWNMTLINTSNEPVFIKIDMVMTDINTGQAVFSGSSRQFALLGGAKQIQLLDVIPVQYNVLNSFYNVDANPDGFLPLGNFGICYSIIQTVNEGLDKIAEECETVIVEPLSPPFLLYPEDISIVDQDRPLFVWIPPAPVNLFSNLNYEFKLVEVNTNQNSSDAIQSNIPVLLQTGIGSATLQYPFSSSSLDTSKVYAWQVKALNNNQPISNTEIFTFQLHTQPNSQSLQNNLYVKLKGLDDIPFTFSSGKLKYEYMNVYNNAFLTLQLVDITSNEKKIINLDDENQSIIYGQNLLELDLTDNREMENEHIYQLEVIGETGDKQALRFIYKRAD